MTKLAIVAYSMMPKKKLDIISIKISLDLNSSMISRVVDGFAETLSGIPVPNPD